MGAKTGIAWCDATWNPLDGCSRISEGCRHCYAETVAARFSKPGQAYHGVAEMTPQGPRWTGTVRLAPRRLTLPLKWQTPKRIFVNSMSDLFHEAAHVRWIDEIVHVMQASPRHTFLVLTKRAARMRVYVEDWEDRLQEPFPENVWLGVSVEDQTAADERLPLLRTTSASVRFASYEPALGPVDFRPYLDWLDWIIVGGESGGWLARPFFQNWAYQVLAHRVGSRAKVFVKQMGSRCYFDTVGGSRLHKFYDHPAGANPAEWDPDLRVQEFPASA